MPIKRPNADVLWAGLKNTVCIQSSDFGDFLHGHDSFYELFNFLDSIRHSCCSLNEVLQLQWESDSLFSM